jgi:hypothetical protein
MKLTLKNIATATFASLAVFSATSAFAINTASVTVTAQVTSEATISGMPSTLTFGNVIPSVLATTDITSGTPQAVSIYDNNPGTGTQINTSCGSGDASGNGCYICTGANCSVSVSRVLLTCTYTPCGAGAAPITITPGSNVPSANYIQGIPAANSSPAACASQAGSFNCTMNKTGQMNTSGDYNGQLNITVSDGT